MNAKGITYTIASALLFGFTPVLASMTYSMRSNAQTLTFYRNLLVVPVLFLMMKAQKVDFRISKREFLDIAIVGILGRSSTTLMLYSSYDYVGIGTATTLHFLYPVFVALICKIFYREKLGFAKVVALVMASIGTGFFLDRNSSAGMIGVALAVASGITYSFYMVGTDKRGLKDMNPSKLSFYMALFISLAMLLYNVPTQEIVFKLSPAAFALTFVVAICTSLFAVVLLQLGIKSLGSTTAAIFCMFEPIASVVSGWLFLGESLSMSKLMGCVVIITAVTILVVAERPSNRSSDSDA